jgi:hypothetical protein
MTQPSDGGPAFPQPSWGTPEAKDWPANGWGMGGMSLRDWYAGCALTGLLTWATHPDLVSPNRRKAVDAAYEYADAMLKAREVKP